MSAVSRRTVAGAATAIAAQRAELTNRALFVEQCSNLHPARGRQVAQCAIDLGLNPDACEAIQLVDKARPELMPRLFFSDPTVAGAQIAIDASALKH